MPTLIQHMIEQAVTDGRGYACSQPDNSYEIELQIALGSMYAKSLEQSIYQATSDDTRTFLQEQRGELMHELDLLRGAAYKAKNKSMRKALIFEPKDVDSLLTNYFSRSVKPVDIEGPSFLMR